MKSLPEIKSLKRIFILLTASLTISVVAAFLYILNDVKRDRINDLNYTSKVIRSYYELSFHQWELSLLSLGNRLVEIEDPQERLDYVNRALEVYEKELLAFGLADTTGQILTFTGASIEKSLPNLISSDRTKRSFQLALERGGLTLGECYYFENVSDWILPIRVPIYNIQNELVAVNTSAIDFSTMIDELDEFGFDPNYQIRLINNEFGTTQLVYPLDPKNYKDILGTVNLTYQDTDTLESIGEINLISGKDPISNSDILYTSSLVDVMDHQLIVSVNRSSILLDFLSRFQYVFLVYIVLAISSIFLYIYMKNNLEKSIAKLGTEKANLKSIIESSSDIIGLFNKDKRLVEFNSTYNATSMATEGYELKS
ncbi:MAG: PDC sensor domain-containing protein, partial [Ekhidna sp.]